ncbi:MAG: S41 family peptidase [Deltaproteobacteria bacterium]|nr:S41 family peptidase [Deltaproteobacteria bacterium]
MTRPGALRLRDVALLALGFAAGLGVTRADAGDQTYVLLSVFAKALHHVEASYVQKLGTDELVYGSIRGLVSRLDPHSSFLDPKEVAALDAEAASVAGDIGLLLGPPGATVLGVFPGSAAERVGIVERDRVVTSDGRAVAAAKDVTLLGPAGSTVELELENERGRRKVSVVRERTPRAGVAWRRLDGDILYLSIGRFAEGVEAKVRAALASARKTGELKGLVLDLRGNPGGLLAEAIRIADLWLDAGTIVVTEGRDRGRVVETAFAKGTEPRYPIAVLIDDQTASASEALAASLSDNRRAKLVGRSTFGKGTVQTVIELDDGSLLRLTVARYYTPSGRSLEGKGLKPDVDVLDPGQQLASALDLLRPR